MNLHNPDLPLMNFATDLIMTLGSLVTEQFDCKDSLHHSLAQFLQNQFYYQQYPWGCHELACCVFWASIFPCYNNF